MAVSADDATGDIPLVTPDMDETPTKTRGLCLVIIALLESFFLSGIIFGWSGLLVILERDGVYHELCPPDFKGTCNEQANKLNLVFVVSSAVFGISVWPNGMILDHFGPRVACMWGGTLSTIGCLLFGLSGKDQPLGDAFLPGYLLLAIGGTAIGFGFLHLSSLFPKHSGLIITAFNAILDLSSLIFGFFEMLNRNGISRQALFLAWAVFGVIIVLTAPFLWPRHPFSRAARGVEIAASEGQESPGADELSTIPEINSDTLSGQLGNRASVPLPKRAYVQQLATPQFVFAFFFTVIQIARIAFYIGTVNDQFLRMLGHSGDQLESTKRSDNWWDNPHRWAVIFSWIMPFVCVLSVPVVGWILDNRSFTVNIWYMWSVNTLYGVMACINSPWVQLGTFVVFGYTRAALFSIICTYTIAVFGIGSFGRLWGTIMCFAGFLQFGIYFFHEWFMVVDNIFWPELVQTLSSAGTVLFPIWMTLKSGM